jgi:perosamine synthetase
MSSLAVLGGEKAVTKDQKDTFAWPIINKEMEESVLDVLRSGSMSGTQITRKFEQEFAKWHGMEFGLGFSSGTASLQTAMFGVGLGYGDEVISPSVTYWATALPALSLGATIVFADIDPDTLCIDPDDIEKRITPRTKAILPVHYAGMPADMDRIMEIAKKHNLKVIEDCSHAHGGKYKGKMIGTFGDVACFSCMSGKSFAIGEAGVLITNNRDIYERSIMFGHYSRQSGDITNPELKKYTGLPWGGYKYRMHQMSAAVGLVQLKKYPSEMEEIDKAMNYFADLLEDTPGIYPIRPPKDSGSTMAGWYACRALYRPEELEGLSVKRFAEAVRAEGSQASPGLNRALHMHPLLYEVDVYHCGKPTNFAHIPEEEAEKLKAVKLPVTEGIQQKVCGIPWFKKYYKDIIEEHAEAFKKAAANYKELLPDDKDRQDAGHWGLSNI